MKRIMMVIIILGLMLPVVAYALGVAGSKHDLTGWATNDNGEVCVYCHTPHGSYGQNTPLWNRTMPASGYTYKLYTSSTMDATQPTQLSNYSLMCLSCHDGVTAFLAVLNAPGPGNPALNLSPGYIPNFGSGDQNTMGAVNIGDNWGGSNIIDLSNDHPVSIEYNSALVNKDGGLYAQPQDSRLKLWNGKVECPTCHDPHNGDISPSGLQFMRMPNTGSQMCLSCHIK